MENEIIEEKVEEVIAEAPASEETVVSPEVVEDASEVM